MIGQDSAIDSLIAKSVNLCERLVAARIERDEQRIRADDLERQLAECAEALECFLEYHDTMINWREWEDRYLPGMSDADLGRIDKDDVLRRQVRLLLAEVKR